MPRCPGRVVLLFSSLQTSLTNAVFLVVAVVVISTFAIYFVGKLRGRAEEDYRSTSESLTNFREMHSEGVISDEEFRTIKTNLSAKLSRELKDTEEKG